MIHLNGTASPVFLGAATINKGVRITNSFISVTGVANLSFVFANAVQGLTLSNNTIQQGGISLLRIVDNYTTASVDNIHLYANVNFTTNIEKVTPNSLRAAAQYYIVKDEDITTKNLWQYDGTYSIISGGGGAYTELGNSATITNSGNTDVAYHTFALPAKYQGKLLQFKFKANVTTTGRSVQAWYNMGGGFDNSYTISLANGINEISMLLLPTATTISVGYRAIGLTGDVMTFSDVELNIVGGTENNKTDYFTRNYAKISLSSAYTAFGINTTTPLYKLDIDANTGSAGNPIRLQGLLAGATSDSLVSSNAGVLKRLSIAQVVNAGVVNQTASPADGATVTIADTTTRLLLLMFQKKFPHLQ